MATTNVGVVIADLGKWCVQLKKLSSPIPGESESGARQRQSVYRSSMLTIMMSLESLNIPIDKAFAEFMSAGATGLESMLLSMLTHPNIAHYYSSWATAWYSAFAGPDETRAGDSGAFIYNFGDGVNRGHACVLSPATAETLFEGGLNAGIIPGPNDHFPPVGIFDKLDAIATFHISPPAPSPSLLFLATGQSMLVTPDVVSIFGTPIATPSEWSGATWMKALKWTGTALAVVSAGIVITSAVAITAPIILGATAAEIGYTYASYDLFKSMADDAAGKVQNIQVNSTPIDDLPQGTITVEIEPGGEIYVGGDLNAIDDKISEEQAK